MFLCVLFSTSLVAGNTSTLVTNVHKSCVHNNDICAIVVACKQSCGDGDDNNDNDNGDDGTSAVDNM